MSERAGPREWVGLAVLALACALISINSNLLNLAFPALTADVRPSSVEVLWISDSYVFAVAGLLIPMGLLADRFGRRRMLLIGAALFGLASIGAALAPDAGWLIVFRTALGAAGAMLAPSTISLIRSMFRDDRQRSIALGIWTAGFAGGGVVGPLIGGALLATGSWRGVFLVTPPAMLLVLLIAPFTLPEHRSDRVRRIDWPGIALAVAGILAVVWAIKQLTAAQSAAVPTAAIGIGGVVLLALFVVRERRAADPAVDLGLFRDRMVTVPLAGNALAFAVLYGNQLLTGQYLQSVLGMPALLAGAWTIPSAVAYALGGLAAPHLVARWSERVVFVGGLVVSAIGFGAQALVGVDDGVVPYVVGSSIAAAGLAPVYQVTTQTVVEAVPVDRAGTAGSTLETLTNVGGALGIAVFGSIAAAIYRAGTRDAGFDSSTVGDAVARAHAASTGTADGLLAIAQQAFVDGFRVTAVIGAVVLLAAAITSFAVLGLRARSVRGRSPAEVNS